ncbi:MAG: hypothetical protein CL678_02555 [Bdellovibrionaceae bacterium]|nr:hypothetical protein [Pseudobdellovibrionaceae bacterium]|tara:strand:+ start:2243 stop:3055 length:813 start_codon:yes stop_codon:yes gene_type:complete
MEMQSLFTFQDYREFLHNYIKSKKNNGRGVRAKWAHFLKVQPTYISQVLNGSANLSPEQAFELSFLLELTSLERKYFLLLVHLDRASTTSLKKFYQDELSVLRAQRFNVGKQLNLKKELSIEQQAIYYSSWVQVAIHVLCSLPDLNGRESLSRYLGLPIERVDQCLQFLEETGLIKKNQIGYSVTKKSIHLSADSPLIFQHHTNWRLRAVNELEKKNKTGLHYSSVVSLSQYDVEKIREKLTQTIKEIKNVIKESPDETVRCFSLDFFQI